MNLKKILKIPKNSLKIFNSKVVNTNHDLYSRYLYLEDGTKIKDLHQVTTSAFKNPLYTFFYVFCMGALSLHLKHGVESAIQTVGLKIKNYQKLFKYVAMAIAFSIPAIFASIPIYLFFTNV